jgi:thioredoxin-like negative regulator of GroEL
MRFCFVLAALPLMLAAPSAFAQDRVASAAITSGDYAGAEKALQAKLRKSPDQPELLLNLAAVYLSTGRDAQARAVYAQVLSQRDVLMDVSQTRSLGAHAVAMNGLKRLQATQLSSR